ncbi:MAG TPA: phasin family protein [Candidatus Competibacteraceae bacterium]|nr:phasin family protein [Candidatus Competibacteraceae bacterium]HQA26311.1 phasin family protein [Candidatus Competibacteraceae bacterium]HQD55215.1 phasin family protein [Candidatus Competibacteraceae bacterium]
MSNDALAKIAEQYQSFLSPVIKANKLSASNLEALVNFQMSTLQSYIDISIARIKAAADIDDPASLQAFLSSQVELIASLQKKFADDSKSLGELMAKFKGDFEKLVQENLPSGK